jgi:hypothetical protein
MAQQMVTLAEQKMKDGSTKLKLVSPFVPGFSDKARALGGTWNPTSKAWYFDTRDVRRIRDLVLSTYGADPLAEPGDEPELVTVRVALDYPDDGGQIWMFGRELASRSSRDYSARLGEGVVVISGGFPRSGGSAKTPRVAADSGTVLEVRDVPRSLVEQEISKRRAAVGPSGNVAWAEARANAITIIESDVQPERAPRAQEQLVALARSLDPAARRSALMSVLLSLDAAERKGLLAEITTFLDQGAI